MHHDPQAKPKVVLLPPVVRCRDVDAVQVLVDVPQELVNSGVQAEALQVPKQRAYLQCQRYVFKSNSFKDIFLYPFPVIDFVFCDTDGVVDEVAQFVQQLQQKAESKFDWFRVMAKEIL